MDTETVTEIEGIFVVHWEVSRFAVITGRRLFGLLPNLEKWAPHFSAVDLEAWGILPAVLFGDARCHRMRVRGYTGPAGRFGHKGFCNRELFVDEIVSCEETSTPGPTW